MAATADKSMHQHGEEVDYEEKFYAYPFKSTLAQCAATGVVSLTYFGYGMIFTMPTIIPGYLLNTKEDIISLNEDEASWFGSLPFLLQPIGAIFGIFLQDYLGQRYGLMLSNVMALLAWILLYYATTTAALLSSAALMGLSLGFNEPAGMGYISEYSEPRHRGFFCSITLTIFSIAVFFEYIVVSMVHWRTSIIGCALISILSLIFLFLIPDSPIWLLSKGKKEKSLKALCWLRGWVPEKEVEDEFHDLCAYVRKSLNYSESTKEYQQIVLRGNFNGLVQYTQNEEQQAVSGLLSSILEKRTMYPLFLITVFEMIIFFAVSMGARVYMINLFDSLQISTNKDWLTLTASGSSMAGNVMVTLLLKYTGKRPLAIVNVFLASLTSVGFGFYAFYKDQLQIPWLFLVLVCLLNFSASQCLPVPWLMMGEIFPVRTRTAGTGLLGSIIDVLMFFYLKTYFIAIRIFGTVSYFMINGICGILGCFYLYRYLPETEGKSLADIENAFSKKSKSRI